MCVCACVRDGASECEHTASSRFHFEEVALCSDPFGSETCLPRFSSTMRKYAFVSDLRDQSLRRRINIQLLDILVAGFKENEQLSSIYHVANSEDICLWGYNQSSPLLELSVHFTKVLVSTAESKRHMNCWRAFPDSEAGSDCNDDFR